MCFFDALLTVENLDLIVCDHLIKSSLTSLKLPLKQKFYLLFCSPFYPLSSTVSGTHYILTEWVNKWTKGRTETLKKDRKEKKKDFQLSVGRIRWGNVINTSHVFDSVFWGRIVSVEPEFQLLVPYHGRSKKSILFWLKRKERLEEIIAWLNKNKIISILGWPQWWRILVLRRCSWK